MEAGRDVRFGFGNNWRSFLQHLTEERIDVAVASLRDMLGVEDLRGKSFLDIGSGSGLFSLAARRLGARVMSFDYDPDSVGCTTSLRDRFFPDDPDWRVERGSALDPAYLRSLGTFDVVYSWGVLHHTGQMWHALDLVCGNVAPGGQLFIAIYNDQGRKSRAWWWIKRVSNALPAPLQPVYAAAVQAPIELRSLGLAVARGQMEAYRASFTRYQSTRGMSRWHDTLDWVGGFPFEVASVSALQSFFEARGFTTERVVPVRGWGCNQLVFRRTVNGA